MQVTRRSVLLPSLYSIISTFSLGNDKFSYNSDDSSMKHAAFNHTIGTYDAKCMYFVNIHDQIFYENELINN